MEFDTAQKRHEIINDMIDEAFDYMEIAAEYEDDNDWAGAKVAFDCLIGIERLIGTEEHFLENFYEMGEMPYRDRDEKEHLLTIFLVDGIHVFVHEVILPDLEHAFNILENWGFRTEDGVEFKNYMCERLEPMIKKYQTIYDI